jgi:hypothetical protein
MWFSNKIYFLGAVVLLLIGELLLLAYLAPSALEAAEIATTPHISNSAVRPEPGPLTAISAYRVVVGGGIVGNVIVYDNPNTNRSADYFELYGTEVDFIAVGWIDRFGIPRLAVDRGLLESRHQLQGELVVVPNGDPI